LGEVICPSLADVPPKIKIDELGTFYKFDVFFSNIQNTIKHFSFVSRHTGIQLEIKNVNELELGKYNNLKIIQNR